MSTFYLLPSRPILGERFAAFLNLVFPGSEWPSGCWTSLADLLSDLAAMPGDVYVVYGDDLPAGEDPQRALADLFGAEAGDSVIEIQAEASGFAFSSRRLQVGAVGRHAA